MYLSVVSLFKNDVGFWLFCISLYQVCAPLGSSDIVAISLHSSIMLAPVSFLARSFLGPVIHNSQFPAALQASLYVAFLFELFSFRSHQQSWRSGVGGQQWEWFAGCRRVRAGRGDC